MNKLKEFWNSLPHQVQAAAIFGLSAMGESLGRAVSDGRLPKTMPDITHFLVTAIATGVAAAWAFYRTPNKPPVPEPAPSLPPDVPKI